MALPDLIEIVPLTAPVRAEITVPGSKSITNRALILAALADGQVTLKGALWSEDTQIMVACLKQLGFLVNVADDPDEACNRTITVIGEGGLIPSGGTEAQPVDLFVGNAGTAARFLAPFLCLGSGVYRLHGVARMHERPQAALFAALRELGYRIESENENEKLPARIFAGTAGQLPQSYTQFERRKAAPETPKKCRVSIEESSQFASALLLSAGFGGWQVEIVGENAEESPYVAMTNKLISWFPDQGGEFEIEPDASSASYFLAAGSIATPSFFIGDEGVRSFWKHLDAVASLKPRLPMTWEEARQQLVAEGLPKENMDALERFDLFPGTSVITVCRKDKMYLSEFQIDAKFQMLWPYLPTGKISRQTDLGDSIMTAIALSALGENTVQFTELGRLRVQECERVVALRTELTKCGAKVIEEGDTLTVYPARLPDIKSKFRLTNNGAEEIKVDDTLPVLHGAEIETYNDHRMAMCFAILGLKVPGIKIKNPACVKKTFPNFFQKLAAAPPHGLGAEIWEIKNGLRIRKLSGNDLFAD
jgi:3-phosphoshikimate 1-carboxyvinyltransferase